MDRDDEDKMSDVYTPSAHSDDDRIWFPPFSQGPDVGPSVESDISNSARAHLRSSTFAGDIYAFGFLVVEVSKSYRLLETF